MGLFGKKKRPDLKPLEYYFEQCPGWWLRNNALELCHCYFNQFVYDFPMTNTLGRCLDWVMPKSNFDKKLNRKDGIPDFPKAYYEESVDPFVLLEMAVDKGDDTAPFVLFMFYEYGIDAFIENDRNLEADIFTLEDMFRCRDSSKADMYRELARNRNSLCEKAYTYIENNYSPNLNTPVEKYELIPEMMFGTNPDVLALFTNDYISEYEFKKIGLVIFSMLARMGSVYAAGYLAFLLNYLLAGKGNEEWLPVIDDYKECSIDEIEKAIEKTIKVIQLRASRGDQKASFVFEHFKFVSI